MRICDLEATGFKFESKNIWVICEQSLSDFSIGFSFYAPLYKVWDLEALIQKEELKKYRFYQSFEEHLKVMQESGICFHNYFQSDKPTIKKFYPWFQPKEEHDSYILSQLFNPDREIPKGCKGAHGLDAWSRRVGREGKVVHEDWSKFSPEMLHRVIEDVKDNVAAWEVLMKEKKEWEDAGGSWDEAIKIEYGIADLQGRQEMHGVKLDIDKAYALADEIYQEIQKIDETLLASMPPRVIRYPEVGYEQEPFTIQGKVKKQAEDWINEN